MVAVPVNGSPTGPLHLDRVSVPYSSPDIEAAIQRASALQPMATEFAKEPSATQRMSGRDLRGHKSDHPVKTNSLSWAPHHNPHRNQMEAAADSFLKAMARQEPRR
jgi:hypothetical protein